MGCLNEERVALGTTVGEALASSPDAPRLFEQHGVVPRTECGMMARLLTIDDAALKCRLRDIDALVDELNAARETSEE